MDTQYEYYIIHRFMLDKLELKGAELNIYAIIYGYSRQGNGAYFGSRKHLADLTGLSVRAVQYALDNLVKSNFIFKRKVDDLIMYECNISKIDSTAIESSAKIARGSAKIARGECKNFTQDNINETIFIDKENKINIFNYTAQALKEHEFSHFFWNGTYKVVVIDKQVYMLLTDTSYCWNDNNLQMLLDRQVKFYNLQMKTNYIEDVHVEWVPNLKEETIYSFMNGARWDYETKTQCNLAIKEI